MGVSQLKRRCLFRRAPPLSAWQSLLRAGASCGHPWWGLHSPAGRFGHMPSGLGQAQLPRCPQRSQLRAARHWSRGSLPHCDSLVGIRIAATEHHQALCGAWKAGEQTDVLGSCPSQRRSSLQVGKPWGKQQRPEAFSGSRGRLQHGWLDPLTPVPANDSQPPAVGMELDKPEFKS